MADELTDVFRAFDQLEQWAVLQDLKEEVRKGDTPSWFAHMITNIFEFAEIIMKSDEHYPPAETYGLHRISGERV